MYSYRDKIKAIELFIKYDKKGSIVIRELGYPSRKMLRLWYNEFIKNGKIRKEFSKKYSQEQKIKAVGYYLSHGKCITKTIQEIGYPSRPVMRLWIDEISPGSRKVFISRKNIIQYSQNQKEQAVIDLCLREGSADKIADTYGVCKLSLYNWKRKILSKKELITLDNLKKQPLPVNTDDLNEEISSLSKQVHRLKLERDILEKANELLKKEEGINLQILTNKERTKLIDALRSTYSLVELLKRLKMPKSSYFYHKNRLQIPDKYINLRKMIKEIFYNNYSCYGYRRIYGIVSRTGEKVSEKIIRKLMAEEALKVFYRKNKKYSSYKGEISPAVENVVNRNFKAEVPNRKWLTDITEFRLPAGKVYLSPIIDCFDGLVVSWSIGRSPNSELVTSMLDAAIDSLSREERPIIHSDRGAHYRWPGWISRMNQAKFIRSMSKKGCSPDNVACEGFFGRLKNEMYYNRDWDNTTIEEFINRLDDYILWYNNKRIKISLGALSPIDYRKSLGLAA